MNPRWLALVLLALTPPASAQPVPEPAPAPPPETEKAETEPPAPPPETQPPKAETEPPAPQPETQPPKAEAKPPEAEPPKAETEAETDSSEPELEDPESELEPPETEPPAAPPAPATPPGAGATPSDTVSGSCSEQIPEGATRPELEVSFPDRGTSGHAVPLTVVVTHGVGETVLPGGVQIKRGSDALVALKESGWILPDPAGGSAPVIERPDDPQGSTAQTTVTLPVVPLPEEAGRHHMTLPRVPITVARANGQLMTVCTPPRAIVVDDPIANEVSPEVRPNPPPRPQREEWLLAKQVAIGLLAALLLGALMAYLLHRHRSRPKPEPEVPKELPWVWALRELDTIRRSGLAEEGRFDELYDRIDHCTRRYLGERYGFDGLESTSEEIRRYLKRVHPPVRDPDTIDEFLTDTDFIKYAEVDATAEDCEKAMGRAELIVRKTKPRHADRIESEHDRRTAA